MNRWVYGATGVLVLVLLSGLAWRVGSRAPAPRAGADAPGAAAAPTAVRASPPPAARPPGVSAPAADPAGFQAQARLTQVETRLGHLERQVQALQTERQARVERSRRSSARPPASAEDAVRDVAPAAAPASDEDARAEAQAAAQERLTTLEAELAAQAPDPPWSSQAVNDISQALHADVFTGTSLTNLACATTLCRLEVRHDDSASRDRFMSEIFPALGWQTSGYSHTAPHPDGSLTTVLYLSREGYSLPTESN